MIDTGFLSQAVDSIEQAVERIEQAKKQNNTDYVNKLRAFIFDIHDKMNSAIDSELSANSEQNIKQNKPQER